MSGRKGCHLVRLESYATLNPLSCIHSLHLFSDSNATQRPGKWKSCYTHLSEWNAYSLQVEIIVVCSHSIRRCSLHENNTARQRAEWTTCFWQKSLTQTFVQVISVGMFLIASTVSELGLNTEDSTSQSKIEYSKYGSIMPVIKTSINLFYSSQ